jgi:hypothetical protein
METNDKQDNGDAPDKEIFKFEANYNCGELVTLRKKRGKLGWYLVVFGAVFIIPAILLGMSDNSTKMAGVLMFLLFAVTIAGTGLYFVTYNKANPKNDTKTMIFTFFDYYIHFRINNELKNKVKDLSQCLYRPYKNKQYIAKVIKSADFISFKIYTGTYNGAPQYARYDIPISCIGTSLSEFEDFIKEQVGNDYKIKTK